MNSSRKMFFITIFFAFVIVLFASILIFYATNYLIQYISLKNNNNIMYDENMGLCVSIGLKQYFNKDDLDSLSVLYAEELYRDMISDSINNHPSLIEQAKAAILQCYYLSSNGKYYIYNTAIIVNSNDYLLASISLYIGGIIYFIAINILAILKMTSKKNVSIK